MHIQFHIYGIGAALVDTEITLSDADLQAMKIDKGVMTLVDEARQHDLVSYLDGHMVTAKRASGGSAANTISAASYFGCDTFYSCKVANDENGDFFIRGMKSAGVTLPSHCTPPAGITGKCLVLITPDAERTMNTFLGVSESLSVNELDLPAIAASAYAYIEGYLVTSPTGRAAAIALREHAEMNNTQTALSLSDPAMVQFFRDGLLEMIGNGVDLIFCNHDEAIGFTQTSNIEEACTALLAYCKKFAITCGKEGALVYDGEKLSRIAGEKVTPIDTNGAGDMFAGAFLYSLTQACDFEKAAKFANLCAAQVVTQFGPRLTPSQHQTLKSAFFK